MPASTNQFIIEFVNSVLEKQAHIVTEQYAKDYLKERVGFFEKLACDLNDEKNTSLSSAEATQLFQSLSNAYYALDRDIGQSDSKTDIYYLYTVAMLKDELERLAEGD